MSKHAEGTRESTIFDRARFRYRFRAGLWRPLVGPRITSGGGGGGWAGAAAVAVGDGGACAEAGAADGAEEGEDALL